MAVEVPRLHLERARDCEGAQKLLGALRSAGAGGGDGGVKGAK
jgi:hypothetical protein